MRAPRKCLVVSAVNLVEGGTLRVLIECLDAAAATLTEEWDIVALVNSSGLIANPRVRCLAFPEAKRSWGARLLTEWGRFKSLSKGLKPDLWLSLHDITPRVEARRQVLYCHNASPFYRSSIREALLDPKFLLFSLMYGCLYKINIGKNYAVVVQQAWMREEFRRRYWCENVIVAHPKGLEPSSDSFPGVRSDKTIFLYPSLARVYKNFEVVCEAAASLPHSMAAQIEIRLTVDKGESSYARALNRRYGKQRGIRFIGRQERAEMERQYSECDVVLFPSKLETWGLPISEAKSWRKPILVADLPYSRETVGTYEQVTFLPPNDAGAWAHAIEGVARGNWKYEGHQMRPPAEPYAPDWPALWRWLTQGL